MRGLTPWLLDSAECQQEFYRIVEKLRADPRTPSSIVIAGPAGGEGTTTVALNVAHAFALGENKRTLIVDANLRHPALHAILDLPLEGGISDWDGVTEPKYQQTAISPNLCVLTAGSRYENSPWQQWRDLVSSLRERAKGSFEIVFWDAPPIAPYPDSLSLARASDGVILVAESDQTKLSLLSYAREQIQEVGASVLGVVLNRRGRYVPKWLR